MTNLSTLITQLEAAAREATPGDWKDFQCMFEGSLPSGGDFEQTKKDANFIALANPHAVLQLTQALREAVEVAEGCNKFFDKMEWVGPNRFSHSDVKLEHDLARDFLARWKGEGT